MAVLADYGDASGGSRWWCCCDGRWRRRFWRLKVAMEKEREGREVRLTAEMRGEAGFLLTFDPNFSPSGAWKSNLFIDSGRGTLFLFWCQILAFGLTWKHPNHWFKVTMMNYQFSVGKMVGQVGLFRAVPLPLKPRSAQTVYTIM